MEHQKQRWKCAAAEPGERGLPFGYHRGNGCTVSGLVLDGQNLGEHVAGISFHREDFFNHPEEDTIRIEHCQVKNFSGEGIALQYLCEFSIRFCQIEQNQGDGLYLNSWDGFLMDNWFPAARAGESDVRRRVSIMPQ